MPATAVALWLITGGLCFVLGIILLWRIERSGVRRWGACGRLFGLGDPEDGPRSGRGDGA
jgi:hypothetical protein